MTKSQPKPKTPPRPTRAAKQWVQGQLLAETLRSSLAEEPPRQLTVRLNPVVAALFEALADRLGVSKNSAANVLIGAALIDSLSSLTEEERAGLLEGVEERLGRKLDLTPPPSPPEMPGMWRGFVDDVKTVVEDIKAVFRGELTG